MKFTYDKPETETRECVAYIDESGDLNIKPDGCSVACTECMCIDVGGFIHLNLKWNPTQATRKFYRGDSITITF